MTDASVTLRRNEWSAPFWEGVTERELRYQHCEDCGRNVFPARRYCPRCASDSLTWHVSRGHGVVYSFSVLELGAISMFANDVPYAIVVVDLDEGFRMTSRIETEDFSIIRCDLPVTVDFSSARVPMPVFRPAGA